MPLFVFIMRWVQGVRHSNPPRVNHGTTIAPNLFSRRPSFCNFLVSINHYTSLLSIIRIPIPNGRSGCTSVNVSPFFFFCTYHCGYRPEKIRSRRQIVFNEKI